MLFWLTLSAVVTNQNILTETKENRTQFTDMKQALQTLIYSALTNLLDSKAFKTCFSFPKVSQSLGL